MGLFLVLFLFEHLLTNSEAALWVGEDGQGFVRMVNFIHSLPYLKVIEVVLLLVPFTVHMIWGVKYLMTAKANSSSSDGSTPALGEYSRNKAYTWQRWTSWFLLLAVVAHVVQMRFVHYPVVAHQGAEKHFMVKVSLDDGLYTVAHRLNAALFDEKKIRQEEALLASHDSDAYARKVMAGGESGGAFDIEKASRLIQAQEFEEYRAWITALKSNPVKNGEVIAVAKDFGTAALLVVRDTFKNPWLVGAYTAFVIAACFHAFNGLWTFLITWGVTLTPRSQLVFGRMTKGLMFLVMFLGLASIWGTYFINLKV